MASPLIPAKAGVQSRALRYWISASAGMVADEDRARPMIDNFALGLTHVLMLVAAWRLLRRPDLDREHGPDPFARFGRRPADDRDA